MYEEIKEKFKQVIEYSQGIQDPIINPLFEKWEKNKKRFIERFGGLIYEWPEQIEFVLDENQKRTKALDFSSTVANTFSNPDLANFIDKNIDTFYENKVSQDFNENIPKGMKLLKAFKYFEKDEIKLRSIQDLASQIIQENKIKGILCFSVHPLDFLSSSENTYNWRSCHALDGDFRAGNLSYMIDDCTFMVYLKGEDNVQLNNFGPVRWNSKKWRMLIHSDPKDRLMFAGRQYPFSSKNGIDTLLNIYNNLIVKESYNKGKIFKDKFCPWSNCYVTSYQDDEQQVQDLTEMYFICGRKLYPLYEFVKQGMYSLNYNDVLNSSCYTRPYYTFLVNSFGCSVYIEDSIIRVGEGAIPCLNCEENTMDLPDAMYCDNCAYNCNFFLKNEYEICDCCGNRIYTNTHESFEVNNNGYIDTVCAECFNKYAFQCDNCKENFYNEKAKYFREGENKLFYCEECYENKLKGDTNNG